jgi:hypothetical protein
MKIFNMVNLFLSNFGSPPGRAGGFLVGLIPVGVELAGKGGDMLLPGEMEKHF